MAVGIILNTGTHAAFEQVLRAALMATTFGGDNLEPAHSVCTQSDASTRGNKMLNSSRERKGQK